MDYKVMVIGEDTLAKTWLSQRMAQESSWIEESLVEICPYRKGYVAEEEITDEAFRNQIPVKVELKTAQYKMKIIDTTGLDNYPGIYEKHVRAASGFALMFFPASRESVANLDLYWEEVRLTRKSRDFPIIFAAYRERRKEGDGAEEPIDYSKLYARLTRRFGVTVMEISQDEETCVETAFRTLMKEVRMYAASHRFEREAKKLKDRCVIS